jgi:hypothetical protein
MSADYATPMPGGGTTASGKKKGKPGAITRIEIEPADNGGYIGTCHHDMSDSSGYVVPTRLAFATIDEVIDFISKKLGKNDK